MKSGERSTAASSPTFEKPELHAASHALSDESGHIVIFVDDTHLYGEALSLRWRSEGHLEQTHKHTYC